MMNAINQKKSRPFSGWGFVMIAALVGAIHIFGGNSASQTTASPAPETYRLIQAIGDTEHESARGLSKAECESRKSELKKVATTLGTYDEKTGAGSITCLPESLFKS